MAEWRNDGEAEEGRNGGSGAETPGNAKPWMTDPLGSLGKSAPEYTSIVVVRVVEY